MNITDAALWRQQAWVDGQWTEAENGEQIVVTNPVDNRPIGTVPALGETQIRAAIAAADRALAGWKAQTAKARATKLRRWFDLIMQHSEDLARILCAEQGKPLAEAQGEIRYAASFVEWFAEQGKRVAGDTLASPVEGQRIVVIKEPVGVCAAITPWNFPAAMVTRKVAPALAAGCTIVIKPAEATPFTALALAALAERAGIPPGVLNVVTGEPKMVGRVLTESPRVRKLSFTGSTATGRLLMAQCAPTVKKLSLELGGNAPFIVFDDADLDAAVRGAVASKYRNNGQTCVCTNRFYIHEDIYDEFAERLTRAVSALRVGNGMDDGIAIGPLIDSRAVEKVEAHVQDALGKGAKIRLGGERHPAGPHFFQPTILTHITDEMRVTKEETFGPLAALSSFRTEEEVITLANNTEYGLAAYVYTANAARSWRMGEALEYGMVGMNTGLLSSEVAPFGGIKQSGFGREGSHYGIEEYLVTKYLCLSVE